MDIRTTKEKYNEWKTIKFLKEHGEYENYINGKIVTLNNKGFKHFPKEICYLKDLEELHLDHNQIRHIPKEICYLKELERLILDRNQITHIPKEIYYLKKLETLNLNNNQINLIPKGISHLKDNLRKIWIQDNPLEQQEKEDIKKLLPNTNIY